MWRATQQIGVKLIFLIRLVILARLLSPEDFGLLAISSLVIDVLIRVTDFGMIPALVQSIDADEKHYDVAWTVGILRALTVTAVTILAAPLVAQIFHEPRTLNIIRMLALRPIIDAAASIRVAGLTRDLHFRSLALMELPKALANTLLSIILASRLGVWCLVAGSLAGSVTYLLASYLLAPCRPRLSLDSRAAQPLIRFGRWIFLTSLTVMAGQSVLRAVVARQLGAGELGLYYLAVSLAFLPVEIASQIVGEVAFPFYSRLQADIRQATLAFRSILISLLTLLLPSLALLIVLAPSLVQTVLGPQWEGTEPIIQVLALANIIGLLGESIVPVLQGSGRPDRVWMIEMIQSSVLISFVWGLTNLYGVVGTALAWIPAVIASQFIGISFVRRTLTRPFAGLGKPIAIVAIISTLTASTAVVVDKATAGLSGFVLACLLGLILAAAMLWTVERRYGLGLSEGLVRAFPRLATLMGLSHVSYARVDTLER